MHINNGSFYGTHIYIYIYIVGTVFAKIRTIDFTCSNPNHYFIWMKTCYCSSGFSIKAKKKKKKKHSHILFHLSSQLSRALLSQTDSLLSMGWSPSPSRGFTHRWRFLKKIKITLDGSMFIIFGFRWLVMVIIFGFFRIGVKYVDHVANKLCKLNFVLGNNINYLSVTERI